MTSPTSLEQQARDLLACPFCGGEPKSTYCTGMVSLWSVRCQKCGAGVEYGCSPFDREARERARAKAEEAWNTRVQPPHQNVGKEGLAERLRELLARREAVRHISIPGDPSYPMSEEAVERAKAGRAAWFEENAQALLEALSNSGGGGD